MLESSLRVGDVGLRSDTPRRRWWLKSPAHQEERGAAVKPLRRECRSDFGVPVLACVRVFVLHARQWVRRAPGIPCALRFRRDTELQDSDAKSRRGNAFCRPGQASACERDPGPVTTGSGVAMTRNAALAQRLLPVVMGPAFAGTTVEY